MTEGRVVGVIGGSGLYELEGLEDIQETVLTTPFGDPSDAYITGRLGETQLVFLPRHGRGHRLTPSEIDSRANLWGMKLLGVSRIISVSAVGSMREDIHPGEFVLIDQFYDRTRHRPDTFFGGGVVAHIAFADPICEDLRQVLYSTRAAAGVKVHDRGTYLNMEGPQFSTRAESHTYRSWGVDVIGMTNLQEAKLAREAEISYATIAMATDYDCWHESHDAVTVDAVLETMKANVEAAKRMIIAAAPLVAAMGPTACDSALANAIMTAPEHIPEEARERLGLLIEKYV